MQKTILMIVAVVMGQSVLAADKKPLTKEESARVIEAAIRKAAKKPTGELTKANFKQASVLNLEFSAITDLSPLLRLKKLGVKKLEGLILGNNKITDVNALTKLKKLKMLELNNNQLTDISALSKLKHLVELDLRNNPNLTKSKIEQLQKALLKCRIYHNAKK
jgi:Leucine-rich repeat (LRR) protein